MSLNLSGYLGIGPGMLQVDSQFTDIHLSQIGSIEAAIGGRYSYGDGNVIRFVLEGAGAFIPQHGGTLGGGVSHSVGKSVYAGFSGGGLITQDSNDHQPKVDPFLGARFTYLPTGASPKGSLYLGSFLGVSMVDGSPLALASFNLGIDF